MPQGKSLLRCLFTFMLGQVAGWAADAPVVPVGVCEILRDLPSFEGKDVALVGRYSFRRNEKWVGDESCAPPVNVPLQIVLVEDLKTAPKLPDHLQLDAPVLNRKFADLQRRAPLGKFRFGTPDYDRWAVIYGRVEARKSDDTKRAVANLVIRGEGVIVVLTPQ